MTEKTPIAEVNLYDGEVYGDGKPGAVLAGYRESYSASYSSPYLIVKVPDYYPTGYDEDWWGHPHELPRRLQRALRKAGGTW